MPHQIPPRAARWFRKLLRSRSGGFDLPAVIVTVVVTGILIAGGAVMAIGIMPWSKDDSAKDSLKPIVTAQQFAKATDRKYLTQEILVKRKLLQPTEDILVGVEKAGGCYTAITKSGTGKIFYVSASSTDARELLPSSDTGCDPVFILRGDGVPDLTASLSEAADYLGGFVETDGKDGFSASYPDTVLLKGDTYKRVKPSVNGGTGSYTYSLNGTLPENVSFDAATGTFSAPAAWRPSTKPAVPAPQSGQWNLGAEAVSGGNGHGCAISSGTVYCWGANDKGQLGQGNYIASDIPMPVKKANGFENKRVTGVTAGTNFTCALEAERAYCWGHNNSGQLGNAAATTGSGNTADSALDMVNVPVKVSTAGTALGNQKVTQISAGDKTVCALAGGQAYCWGSTVGGVRGDGISTDRKAADEHFSAAQRKALAVPVQVISSGALAEKTITKIDVGYTHSCAVANSRAYCWGINKSGELGTGANVASNVPVAVLTTTGMAGSITDINVGGVYHAVGNDMASTCAVSSDKTFCWGANAGNAEGKLGIGTADVNKTSPTAVVAPAGRKAVAVDVGYDLACAVYDDTAGDGDAYCWGRGNSYKLGNGILSNSRTPVAVKGMDGKDVVSLSVGGYHVQALTSGGAYGWGQNTDGKTGTNTAGDRPTALPVHKFGGNFGFPSSGLSVTISDGVDTETVEVVLELR